MNQIIQFVIGIVVLILGFPIGTYLAKMTKEELKDGQVWFKFLIIISFIGSIISIVLRNDVFLFSFLFICVVTSRSLKIKKKRK